MYSVETFGDSWILVDNRLVVGSNTSLSRMFSLMKEMENVDKTYPIVFELAAFAAYHYLPNNTFEVLKKLEVGKYMMHRETKIIKVSPSLCVGINLLVEYVYTEDGKTVNKEVLKGEKQLPAKYLEKRPEDEEVECELI